MLKFIGKGVSGGVAVGKVSLFKKKETKIKRQSVSDNDKEILRFERAKEDTKKSLIEIYEKALREVGETGAEIFQIHIMMLEDEDFEKSIRSIIEHQKVNAEYAVSITGANFSEMFSSMDDHYMKARAIDVKDISDRLISCMTEDKNGISDISEPSVICARDLTPSDTVLFDKEKILGFITAHGSANSHTAILARNMNIPAIIGVGDAFLESVKNGEAIAVDGSTGEIFLSPDADTQKRLEKKRKESVEKRQLLKKLRGKENVTLDGTKINIYANIGSAEDIGRVLANDAGGIGLFRSEFLYLEKSDYPTEEEQFEIYKKVLLAMPGKRVIIRTLDIGADKKVNYFNLDKEENPALGLRGIRLCLNRPEIFKTQLRALFAASNFGKLGIMFPMIANVWEAEKVLEICGKVKEGLQRDGIMFSSDIELGIMIETPAAALISHRLAKMFDFFSVGTNDLLQYTIACDRQNPSIEAFLDSHHEALLTLIRISAENAHKNGRWIGICGELASDTELTRTFLEMGIDELSVSPREILKLREKVRSISLK